MRNEALHHTIFCHKLFDKLKDNQNLSTVTDHLNFLTTIEELMDHYSCLMDECESPIEMMLGAAILFIADGYGDVHYRMQGPSTFQEEMLSLSQSGGIGTFIGAQVDIGGYRADFMLACICKDIIQYMVIECDGHDYHERTKQQASRDKKRDRAFTALNIPVLRFTGSDIHRNLDECCEEISSYLFNKMEGLLIHKGIVEPFVRKAP